MQGLVPRHGLFPPPHAVMFLSKRHVTARGAFSFSKLRFKSQLRFKSISSYWDLCQQSLGWADTLRGWRPAVCWLLWAAFLSFPLSTCLLRSEFFLSGQLTSRCLNPGCIWLCYTVEVAATLVPRTLTGSENWLRSRWMALRGSAARLAPRYLHHVLMRRHSLGLMGWRLRGEVWQPKFDFPDPQGGKREQALASYPLTSTSAEWQAPTP